MWCAVDGIGIKCPGLLWKILKNLVFLECPVFRVRPIFMGCPVFGGILVFTDVLYLVVSCIQGMSFIWGSCIHGMSCIWLVTAVVYKARATSIEEDTGLLYTSQ